MASTPERPAGRPHDRTEGSEDEEVDPLRTVRASQREWRPDNATTANSPSMGSPMSFKRRGTGANGGSTSNTSSPMASPGLAAGLGIPAARRSLSDLWSRRTGDAPKSISLSNDNSASNTPLTRSPAGTPSSRRVSTANPRAGAARKASTATAGGRLRPPPLSPGATSPRSGGVSALGRRIQDWQTASSSNDVSRAADAEDGTRTPLGETGFLGGGDDDDNGDMDDVDNEPIVPQMLPALRTPEYETPLPKLPIVVLAICMVGEFLSASVGGPFLFFMLEDLGVPGGGGESAVGLWAGIVSASFFLTQFATALLWASAGARFGRRAVLFASLLGNTIMLLCYGTCRSVWLMVVIRMLQGAFNGAVGVARSAVKDITDSTNEGRAYSIVGLAWSLGGIFGPAIGGWTEHPVENLPRFFGNSQLFSSYPYLLPCSIAASVTGTGCVLSLFLSYDGGQREGGIRLPEEKDVERAVHKVASFPGSVKKKVSGYFGPNTTSDEPAHEIMSPGARTAYTDRRESIAIRQGARTSFAIPHRGSAYGYDPRRRDTAISRFRKMSTATSTRYAPDFEGEGEYEPAPLNFAQKLLLANDEAGMFNITDLWVAAATREDGLPYSSANLEEDVFADDEDESMAINDESQATADEIDPFSDEMSQQGGQNPNVSRLRNDSMATGSVGTGRLTSPYRRTAAARQAGLRNRANSVMSTASRPAIYHNTGLSQSPAASMLPRREPALQPYLDQPPTPGLSGAPPALAAIPEGKASSAGLFTVPGTEAGDASTVREASPGPETAIAEKDPLQDFSIMRDLPITLIFQYALLALHGTIMDQVFMSFLVSKTAAGGLGLEASDFADIIACMCIFQMLFQFRFYPSVSMPIGRLTHVQMFRLGLCLYLIPYIFFPELRPLLTPEGERTKVVTFGLILLTATRYLANTCAYTAVMILINAMTPAPYIPMANGLAQSLVSLARFIGPLTGGVLWSRSIAEGPEGYYVPFMIIAGICTLGLLHSFTLR